MKTPPPTPKANSAIVPFPSKVAAGSEAPTKTIAVTGGAGFLGSHLCETLVAAGHTVVCLDNYHTGRASNVRHLKDSGRFTMLEHDMVEPIPDNLPTFDEIYNLACPASPVHYQADPIKTALTCALGALNALRRAERDASVLFQASTSEVYGDPKVHPQPEKYLGNVNSVGTRSCYDEGKRFAEALVSDFGRERGVTVKIGRIFNTYGPRMRADDGRVVSNFIVQALRDDDVTIYGLGKQTRSFCYVDDLIDGILRLMATGNEVTAPVNLGNPVETRMVDLAEMILEMTGSGSKVVRRPLPLDDPKRRWPDISRAIAVLDWKPQVPLREGLALTIAYFQEELREGPADTEAASASLVTA